MQKTFCDGCGKEIPANTKGVLTKWKITVEREEETADGNISTTGEIAAEVCGICKRRIGTLISGELHP